MKKNLVLFILFIFPIVAYVFCASGIYNFGKLPTITNNIPDVNVFKTNENEQVTLNKKITILSFTGTNVIHNQGRYFNLTEEIFDKNKKFKDFQMILIAPYGTQDSINILLKKIEKLTDVSSWNIIFASADEIKAFHTGLKIKQKLDADLGTKMVYIIDKNRNLRGRNDPKQYKEGYDTTSPADLHNEMSDDVKIILAEYRFALKRNNNKLKTIEVKNKVEDKNNQSQSQPQS